MNHFNYLTADLLMDDVNHKVNMMDLPFDDGSFGFFICSHVLEHVESDDRAIDELFRITKRGGLGILMAPIIVGLEKTLEDPSVTDEAGRWRNFGQGDHVRLYAHDDYLRKIRHHGFRVDELGERRLRYASISFARPQADQRFVYCIQVTATGSHPPGPDLEWLTTESGPISDCKARSPAHLPK